MTEIVSDTKSRPDKKFPWFTEKSETIAFYEDHFIDVGAAFDHITINSTFTFNPELRAQIPNWPNIDTSLFCKFSVPKKNESRRVILNDHPIIQSLRRLFGGKLIPETAVDLPPTTPQQNHWGMGRGLSSLHLPLEGSSLATELRKDDTKSKPGLIGVYDSKFGFFYANLGLKGNGPTANEIRKTALNPELGAKKRIEYHEAWGILWEPTALEIEQPILESLADIGFRVGRVIATVALDKVMLAELVTPYYQEAGLDEQYDIRRELKKGDPSWKPAIIARLGGGERIDVLDRADSSLEILEKGMYCLSSEMFKMDEINDEKGSKLFQQKYKFPDSYLQYIDTISEYDYSQELRADYLYAYFWIISFLMWRNYHMQDEYNKKYPNPEHQNLGPLWLNYKPGDWDVGGFIFDVDVFEYKRDLAERIGEAKVRQSDADALRKGLQSIANKMLLSLPNLPIHDIIQKTFQDSLEISQREGFIINDAEQDFYLY